MSEVFCVASSGRVLSQVRAAVAPLPVRRYTDVSELHVHAPDSDLHGVCIFLVRYDESDYRSIRSLAYAGVPVIAILPTPSVRRAAELMRAGAYDCLAIPIRRDEIASCVGKAMLTRGSLTAPISRVGDEPRVCTTVDRTLDRFARSDLPVHITGESGAGKEVAARNIHERSDRAGRPFVVRNCAAIPESLFESELFGTHNGAYTGAISRAGALEEANRGTIFLDEIGELPPSKQAALLRVLEDRRVRRIGANSSHVVSFRLITATNRDLAAEIMRGAFRRDLYYRIHVLSLHIPPLRMRRADIPALCKRFAFELGGEPIRFTPQAIELLQQQHWPGNVRELRNVVQRLGVLSDYGLITRELVQETLSMERLTGLLNG